MKRSGGRFPARKSRRGSSPHRAYTFCRLLILPRRALAGRMCGPTSLASTPEPKTMPPISMIERVGALALLVAAISSPCAAQKASRHDEASRTPRRSRFTPCSNARPESRSLRTSCREIPRRSRSSSPTDEAHRCTQPAGSGARYAKRAKPSSSGTRATRRYLRKGETSYADCSTS